MRSSELRAMRWACIGVVAITVGFLANLWLLDLLARDVHARLDHDLDPSVGLGSNAARLTVGFGALLCYVPVVVGFAAIVYWSYCAAQTGLRLGLPARHNVALGLASWFLPIVNFWWPYQVIVDTLPPRSANRRWVLTWWVVWQIALYVAPLHFVNALFGWRALDVPLFTVGIVVLVASCGLGLVSLVRVTNWHIRMLAPLQLPNA